MKEIIGTNAGLVWEYLSQKEEGITLNQIKKDTKLSIRDLYAAIGWLAREGKVAFVELKDDYQVVLMN